MKKLTIKEADEVMKDYDNSKECEYIDLSNSLKMTDHLMIRICDQIVRYKREKNLSGSELALKLKTNESKISYINTRSIKKLNLEELLCFLEEIKDDSGIQKSLKLIELSF